MRDGTRLCGGRHRNCFLPILTLTLLFFTYIEQVVSLPIEPSNQWPTFPRRNIASLARDGYLRGATSYKRSISTLAKNGQLPTFRSPYDDTDTHEQDEDESHEKRNIASIARLRSYSAMKRNIQALARDGYRTGRGQSSQQNDKRNIQSLARNGLLHKKNDITGDEYYYPFYQNPIPPLSEVDGPYDLNEMYDLQQSVNPDMFPPLSQIFKRSTADHMTDAKYLNQMDWYLKRGSAGMPVHGLYRPAFAEPASRSKRYILSLPDELDHNDVNEQDADDNPNEDKRSVDEDSEIRNDFEKRHIGSLARKHSPNENFGIREYFAGAEAESAGDPDDADIPPAAIPSNSHPTGRILHRPLNNDVPTAPALPPSPPLPPPNYIDPFTKNQWSPSKEIPKYYYFRSLKVPYHQSGKRYLLIPAVDNILLRKTYRNSSLPSRRKNQ